MLLLVLSTRPRWPLGSASMQVTLYPASCRVRDKNIVGYDVVCVVHRHMQLGEQHLQKASAHHAPADGELQGTQR
jgi:hypothetical protein